MVSARSSTLKKLLHNCRRLPSTHLRPQSQLRLHLQPCHNQNLSWFGIRHKSTKHRNLDLLQSIKKGQQGFPFDVPKDPLDDIRETQSALPSAPGIHSPESEALKTAVGDAERRSNHIYNKLKPITPNDLYVSCTTFDRAGNIVAVSKKYPKMKFLKDNNLFPRDLRKIDTSSIDVVPSIMVRSSNAILINLLHIKAIIKNDSVKVFDTSTPQIATRLGLFMYDLEMKLKMPAASSANLSNATCYEFRALESILISVMSYLEAELKTHMASCGHILSELEDHIDRSKLQDLLIKSKKLSSFYQKAVLIRDVLEELLENDEDLAGMYLTDPQKYVAHVASDDQESTSNSASSDFEDLEMILESYYNQCDEFVQQAGSLINDIKATEEIVNIILDANRNSLMLFELKITVYTLGFTVATLLPAFYGMNLKNYIEESNLGFGAVVLFSVIQGLLITAFNFRKLRRVQKLTMMGGNGIGGSGGSGDSGKLLRVPQVRGFFTKKTWYRILYGRRTRFDKATSKEKDLIWRMINDDRPMK